MAEATATEQVQRDRKRTLYFNIDRQEAFDEIAGETILVERTDVKGNPYHETMTVPDDLTAATYLAFDHFIEFVRNHIQQED